MNNKVSYLIDGTIIEKYTNVYKTIKSLNKGDAISFGGDFLKSDTDYFEESSMTIQGSMTSPEYKFKFSSVSSTQF